MQSWNKEAIPSFWSFILSPSSNTHREACQQCITLWRVSLQQNWARQLCSQVSAKTTHHTLDWNRAHTFSKRRKVENKGSLLLSKKNSFQRLNRNWGSEKRTSGHWSQWHSQPHVVMKNNAETRCHQEQRPSAGTAKGAREPLSRNLRATSHTQQSCRSPAKVTPQALWSSTFFPAIHSYQKHSKYMLLREHRSGSDIHSQALQCCCRKPHAVTTYNHTGLLAWPKRTERPLWGKSSHPRLDAVEST